MFGSKFPLNSCTEDQECGTTWSCEDVVGEIRDSLVANRKGGQLAAFCSYKINLYRIFIIMVFSTCLDSRQLYF